MTLTLTFWGTRGSVPSPGASTAYFGGNTPCLALRTGTGALMILDGGTGIRHLGRPPPDRPGGSPNVPASPLAPRRSPTGAGCRRTPCRGRPKIARQTREPPRKYAQ